MPARPREDKLSEKHYVSVILRLLLDRRGRLIQGEVVDLAGHAQHRFVGWRGLAHALRQWLATQPSTTTQPETTKNSSPEDST